MKQIIQHLNNGLTELVEVLCPAVRDGHVLVQSSRSLVVAGHGADAGGVRQGLAAGEGEVAAG